MILEILNHVKNKSIGLFFVMVVIYVLVAIISYSPDDPSLDYASDGQIKNIAGYFGAMFADPILHAFGYAIMLPLIFLLISGVQFLLYTKPRLFMLRAAILILTLIPLTTLLSFTSDNRVEVMDNGGYIGKFLKGEFTQHLTPSLIITACSIILLCSAFIIFGLSPKSIRFTFKSYLTRLIKLFLILQAVALFIRNLIMLLLDKYVFKSNKYDDSNINLDEGDQLSDRAGPSMNLFKSNYTQDTEDAQVQSIQLPYMEEIKSSLLSFAQAAIKGSKSQNINNATYNETHHSIDLELPKVDFLKQQPYLGRIHATSESILQHNSKLLMQVLQDFGIQGQIISVNPGPVVTLYELEPAAGTKSSRVIGLSDDIARSMSAISARIDVVQGKNALGIELPNSYRETVYLREILETESYIESNAALKLALGKNISGEPVVVDLGKMPHLLVAGTTGSGKSVAVNTMILSLLYQHTPKTCQFIMIDPKMLELSVYDGIPHLLSPVVTDPRKAVIALKWVVKEMENRYRAMSAVGVRNISGYNKLIDEANNNGNVLERNVQTGFDEQGRPKFETIKMSSEPLPYIVVIVDEMADLMLVSGKEIESYIQRLAQMARAAGIHIIMATQRPSVDVITGVIKANFPTRISFQVTSQTDSRTIINSRGAEQLLGMGDMLYMAGGGKVIRVHGPFVSDEEVELVVNHLKAQATPNYISEITDDASDESAYMRENYGGSTSDQIDDMYKQAIEAVLRDKKPTTSYIQRCLKIGYNKAATFIEQMERDGIVSPPNHSGKREILMQGTDDSRI